MIENNKWVEETLGDKRIALIGYADLLEIAADIRRGFRYGISIAIALSVFPSTTDKPSIEYYDEYRKVSKELGEASRFLADKIIERGFNAYSLAGERQNEDFRTPLPFKTLATKAGLGWIGKSAALITKEYGNAIRLNGVLTDMPLATGTPITSSLCGDCMECVNSCPGKAITGNLWDITADREYLLNANECKQAVIVRGILMGKMFDITEVTEGTCGICISVCPWTKKYVNKRKVKNIYE